MNEVPFDGSCWNVNEVPFVTGTGTRSGSCLVRAFNWTERPLNQTKIGDKIVIPQILASYKSHCLNSTTRQAARGASQWTFSRNSAGRIDF